MSNVEKLLTAILNDDDIANYECHSRIEEYLKNICLGESCEHMTPQSRVEYLLKVLSEKGFGGGPSEEPTGTMHIYSNGKYDVTKYATADVNVEQPLQEKSVSSNGVVVPDSGFYGLSRVNVNVPQSGGGSGGEVPDYMSAKNFTFAEGTCTGYIGDPSYPEIIVPKSYSVIEEQMTFSGVPILDLQAFIEMSLNMSVDPNSVVVVLCDLAGNEQQFTGQELNNAFEMYQEGALLKMYIAPVSINENEREFMCLMALMYPANYEQGTFNSYEELQQYLIDTGTNQIYFTETQITIQNAIDGNDYQVNAVGGSFQNYRGALILQNNITELYGIYGGSQISKIFLPNSITKIQTGAFSDCDNLKNIDFPNNLTTLGGSVFESCDGLEYAIMPKVDYDTNEMMYFYSHCGNLKNVLVPNYVTRIYDRMFQGCSSLQKIDLPNTITEMGSGAFSGCSSLTKINIPNGVTELRDSLFSDCTGLLNINIPDNITSIGSFTFENCTGLTWIEIPSNVTYMGGGAFSGCTNIRYANVYMSTNSENQGDFWFDGCRNITIHALSLFDAETAAQTFGQYWNYIDYETQATTYFDL